MVLVRPGERIAADGAVVAGASEVDQATITGEPLPVDKTVGDEVFAGTLNGIGALRVRVDRRAEDSVVARIATLVERASPDQGPHPVVHREDRTAPRSLRPPKTSSQAGIFQAGPDRISASKGTTFSGVAHFYSFVRPGVCDASARLDGHLVTHLFRSACTSTITCCGAVETCESVIGVRTRPVFARGSRSLCFR